MTRKKLTVQARAQRWAAACLPGFIDPYWADLAYKAGYRAAQSSRRKKK